MEQAQLHIQIKSVWNSGIKQAQARGGQAPPTWVGHQPYREDLIGRTQEKYRMKEKPWSWLPNLWVLFGVGGAVLDYLLPINQSFNQCDISQSAVGSSVKQPFETMPWLTSHDWKGVS